ncbi:NF7O factor, partial [Atractosteus spatula]|nr:NF7O factor [Atractosteus spatula]
MAQAPASLETTSALAAELECPVCLELFRDPLLLDCGHNVCRACVAAVLRGGGGGGGGGGGRGGAAASALCPECRAAVPDPASLKTNRALRNLADRARQLLPSEAGDRGGRVGPGPGPGSGSWADRCPQHGEKPEFYCDTDRRLTCRACRDTGDHDGHAVRPLAEAAGVFKAELSDAVQFLLTDNQALRSLQEAQRAEIAGIRVRPLSNPQLIPAALTRGDLRDWGPPGTVNWGSPWTGGTSP